MTTEVKVRFKLAKETKNKFRFEEVDETGVLKDFNASMVGTLYVQKVLFGTKRPSHVTITVHVDG
jgi:hypothetical protein